MWFFNIFFKNVMEVFVKPNPGKLACMGMSNKVRVSKKLAVFDFL